jgi:hypothetical protein
LLLLLLLLLYLLLLPLLPVLPVLPLVLLLPLLLPPPRLLLLAGTSLPTRVLGRRWSVRSAWRTLSRTARATCRPRYTLASRALSRAASGALTLALRKRIRCNALYARHPRSASPCSTFTTIAAPALPVTFLHDHPHRTTVVPMPDVLVPVLVATVAFAEARLLRPLAAFEAARICPYESLVIALTLAARRASIKGSTSKSVANGSCVPW